MRWMVNPSGSAVRELRLFRFAVVTSWMVKGVAVVLSVRVLRRHLLTRVASGSDE